MKRTRIALIALGALAWHLSTPGLAQTPPAPPPVQGTIALEGTMKKVYHATNVVIVATIDGVEHAYHFTKDLVVHGGKGGGVEGLEEGRTVVVHYVPAAGDPSAVEIDELGDGGLKTSEGVVTRIDRSHDEITIRFANGQTETLRLTKRAASESESVLEGKDTGERVVVYYTDENGRKVAHYFKKVS